MAAALEAHPTAKETTFGPFANPSKGNAKLRFEIGLPDLAQPALDRVWGSGNTITTRNLTDRARLGLINPEISLRTWDDNPQGVKVFIVAGQSNMVRRGQYDKGQADKIGGVGSLREQVEKDPANFGHFVDTDGKWKEIDTMKFWWSRTGGGLSLRVGIKA